MTAIQIVLTRAELETVDRFIRQGGDSKNRADLVRKATLEYCLRHGSSLEDKEGRG